MYNKLTTNKWNHSKAAHTNTNHTLVTVSPLTLSTQRKFGKDVPTYDLQPPGYHLTM